MPWQLYALGSITLYCTLNILQRVAATDSKNPRAMAVVFTAIAGIMAIVYALLNGSLNSINLHTQPQAWMVLILSCLFYGFFERGRFYAAKLLDVSIFTTIINVSLAVSFVASVIVYGEPLSVLKVVGALLIFFALLLVSYEKNASQTKTVSVKGVLITLGISVLLGLAWTIDRQGARYFDPTIYTVFVWTLPTLVILFPSIKIAELKEEIRVGSWKIYVMSGLNVFGYLFQVKALEKADVTQVMPLISTSTLITVMLGIFFLNEKKNIPQKIVGSVIALIGAYLLI